LNATLLNNNIEAIHLHQSSRVDGTGWFQGDELYMYTSTNVLKNKIYKPKQLTQSKSLNLLDLFTQQENITIEDIHHLIDKYFDLLQTNVQSSCKWFKVDDPIGLCFKLFNKQNIIRIIYFDVDNLLYNDNNVITKFKSIDDMYSFLKFQIDPINL
jgi:hypothetical protein